MEPAHLAAIEAVLLIAIAILFLLLGRRLSGGAEEVPTLRAVVADLTQRLAVAEHKATLAGTAEAAAKDAARHRDEAREARVRAEMELTARAATVAEREAALAQAKVLEAELRARAETLAADKAERERLHAHEAALVAERTLALGRAGEALQAAQTEAEMQRGEISRLRVDLAALGEKLTHEQREAQAKLAVLEGARTAMAEQFKTLADEIMQRHGESFAKRNQEQLDGTLVPLRQKILEFQQSLQTAHLDGEKERAALAQQIRSLSETSARMQTRLLNPSLPSSRSA